MHEMCSNGNQTNTEWHLYPVDYKPYETSGARTNSFFRIGSINWRCIDLAVRCTTRTQLQMIQRCQQASAVYTVDLINSNYGVRNLDRCCQTLLQLRPGVDETQSSVCLYPNAGYEVWGHASKILFVEKCHNVLQKGSSVNGYWLFVSQNNSDIMEIKKALEALLKHYPFLRLHGWKNALVNKAACDCASFDNYILQSMQCNAPMYDRYQDNSSKVVPRKEKGLRLVDVESITIVVPKFISLMMSDARCDRCVKSVGWKGAKMVVRERMQVTGVCAYVVSTVFDERLLHLRCLP
uniref:Uncharacterized protein n=1 Tax=Anopheles culicifacies TaxID=139723 RepID=A0A182MCL3_9DIPT